MTTTDTKAGLLATANGTVRDYRNLGAFWLIHDATGIYAMSAVCTHLGCIIGQGGTAFACPCHGSQYDLNGGNTQGPASVPLPHYEVTEPTPGANLVVDTSKTVASTVRMT
jgi:cytochrome b6-f complex iron-sulfur subunit